MRSFGQMASKLPVVKVGGLTKKFAIRPRPHSNQSARVRGVPGLNHSQSLMADNFAALWPTDPKFSSFKDLNLFNPKKMGGWISPEDFRAVAVLYRMKLWLSNLHLIIIFGVYNKWKTIILGVVFKNFEKFAFEKIFFL